MESVRREIRISEWMRGEEDQQIGKFGRVWARMSGCIQKRGWGMLG